MQALSYYNQTTDKLRIFVATPSNVSADMMTSIVAEAIVHEYMESFGLSHHHAVISELLLSPFTRLPQRVSYQLASSAADELLGMQFICSVFVKLVHRPM